MSKCAMRIALAAALALPGLAPAEYPEKPVEFIVPFPPGDLETVLTRMIAEDFEAAYGVTATVINVPGGGNGPFPGAVAVAKAAPDGYTIGSFTVGVPTVGPQLGIPELEPNPFEPLGIFLTYPFVIVTGPDASYVDLDGLADYAKDHDVVLGHFGAPLIPTRVTLALARAYGFEFSAETSYDALDCDTLLSGEVDVMNTTLQLVRPCLEEITVLASVGSERIPVTPEAPTVAQLVPELDIALWNGLFVHKDTPADVREKIARVAERTMASARAQQLVADTGAQIYWENAEDATDRIEQSIAAMAAMEKLLGKPRP